MMKLLKKLIILITLLTQVLKSAFNIHLDGHYINHINSKTTINPKYLEIEKIHVKNIVKEMADIYAR